jgi:hypothetical protein
MNVDNIVLAIKSFFMDIIGFLLPGFVSLTIGAFCIDHYVIASYNFILPNFDNYILIITLSYCLGYVIYGVSIIKDRIFEGFSFNLKKIKEEGKTKALVIFYKELNFLNPKTVNLEIEESFEYNYCNNNLFHIFGNDDKFKLNFKSNRNLLMAKYPGLDEKIYIYMFRSELCNHLSSSLIIISLLGLLSIIITYGFTGVFILRVDKFYIALYFLILPFMFYLLNKTRMRFLKIAYKLIFSIHMSKEIQ